MNLSTILIIALAGGLMPALVWLYFWLQEDSARPEPASQIVLAFFSGMLAVLIVLPIQKLFISTASITAFTIFIWAFLEESLKYIAADISINSKNADEPVDMMMYLIIAAIGFSAMENALFLIRPIAEGNFSQTILITISRFIGTTLIHILGSAIIGVGLAKTFYKPKLIKGLVTIGSVVLATALHGSFNLFIIQSSSLKTGIAYCVVWLLIIALMAVFEKVKAGESAQVAALPQSK